MIFIGAELSDPHAHFVTNIIASIGTGEDLIIDLLNVNDSEMIFAKITSHLNNHDEQFTKRTSCEFVTNVTIGYSSITNDSKVNCG